MKRTLLDMTQDILSSLDSDEVNSIGDTTESLQVANIIKNTWWNIVSRAELPEHFDMFGLDASTDIVLPVLMLKPNNVDNIKWIKYYDESTQATDGTSFIHDLNTDITSATPNTSNSDLNYKTVQILPITEFLTYINRYNPYENNVESYTLSGMTLRYRNDRQPSCCGVLSDKYVLFDSFDSTIENTLQQSKIQAYGQIIPEFKLEDNFIPLMDDYQFPLLFNEAKSLAFFELKQMAHQKAEQEAKRQWSSLQKDKAVVDKPTYFNQFPNFGRK